ncbi:MAG: HPF/RaiA family ribosome-associated protein [Woeseiaceae bacterium]|nr:HPF/RaiA family ribosome-associated protein [Woeseiaceae bacterium]
MNITTTTQNFESSVALDTFVRSRLKNALARLDEDIIAIDVFMKDVNGPKGGVDKQALIRVRLRNRQVITIESTHQNLYAAVRTSVKRTRQAVRRQLRKSRQIDKQRVRDMAAHDDVFGTGEVAARTAMPRVPWI